MTRTTSPLPDPERLRWQCRRGMLELDYLLEAFLEHLYPFLHDEAKHHFADLLAHPDPDLQAWLLGEREPESAALRPLVESMRRLRL